VAKLSKAYPTDADVWELARHKVDAISDEGEPMAQPMRDNDDKISRAGPIRRKSPRQTAQTPSASCGTRCSAKRTQPRAHER